MKRKNPYADLLDLPHPEPKLHHRMPMAERAAQFSPFAALAGHQDAIRETARLTDARADLEEDTLALLDRRLQLLLLQHLEEKPEVTVTYFSPDGKKSGGAYLTLQGRAEKIDGSGNNLLLQDGTEIPLQDIFSISGEWLDSLASAQG